MEKTIERTNDDKNKAAAENTTDYCGVSPGVSPHLLLAVENVLQDNEESNSNKALQTADGISVAEIPKPAQNPETNTNASCAANQMSTPIAIPPNLETTHHLTANGLERIRRPPNAFFLFAKANRRKVSDLIPNLKNAEISTKLGEIWQRLPAANKRIFQDQAKLLEQEHKLKYPGYTYKPSPRGQKVKKKNIKALTSKPEEFKPINPAVQPIAPMQNAPVFHGMAPVFNPPFPVYNNQCKVPMNAPIMSNPYNAVAQPVFLPPRPPVPTQNTQFVQQPVMQQPINQMTQQPLVQQPIKQVVQQPVIQQPLRQVVQQVVPRPPQQVAQQPIQQMIQEPIKQPDKVPQDVVHQPFKPVVQQSVQQAIEQPSNQDQPSQQHNDKTCPAATTDGARLPSKCPNCDFVLKPTEEPEPPKEIRIKVIAPQLEEIENHGIAINSDDDNSFNSSDELEIADIPKPKPKLSSKTPKIKLRQPKKKNQKKASGTTNNKENQKKKPTNKRTFSGKTVVDESVGNVGEFVDSLTRSVQEKIMSPVPVLSETLRNKDGNITTVHSQKTSNGFETVIKHFKKSPNVADILAGGDGKNIPHYGGKPVSEAMPVVPVSFYENRAPAPYYGYTHQNYQYGNILMENHPQNMMIAPQTEPLNFSHQSKPATNQSYAVTGPGSKGGMMEPNNPHVLNIMPNPMYVTPIMCKPDNMYQAAQLAHIPQQSMGSAVHGNTGQGPTYC